MSSNLILSPLPSLNPAFNKDPAQLAVQEEKKAFRYDLLSKITLIAIGLLALITLAASFTIPGASASYLLTGAIVVTPFLSRQAQKWTQYAITAGEQAVFFRKIEIEKKVLNDSDFSPLYAAARYNVVFAQGIPINSYGNVIAEYEACEKERIDLSQQSEQTLKKLIGIKDPKLRLIAHCRFVELSQAIIALLFKQAFLLDLIEHPREEDQKFLLPQGTIIKLPPELVAFDTSVGDIATIVYTSGEDSSPNPVQLSIQELSLILPMQYPPKELCKRLRQKHALPEIERRPNSASEQSDEKTPLSTDELP